MPVSRRIRLAIPAATMALALGLASPGAAQASLGSLGGFLSGTGTPKNIIYLVGDGMGFNHVAANNIFESGQSRYLVEGDADPSTLTEADGEPVQVFEQDGWSQLAATTYPEGSGYDGEQAWSDHDYVNDGFTDSAAAGTGMATGQKTTNGALGVDSSGAPMENASERAIALGKAAGVVSDVPFSHATPAAWAAHNESRQNYHEIGEEMIASELDVIFGAGHPYFDDDNQPVEDSEYTYMSPESFEQVSGGETGFTYFEEAADFHDLAAGAVEPGARYFGLSQVESTLHYERSGTSQTPGDIPGNDVADLDVQTEAALNVLGQNPLGFHVMIEAGAIDWAGHDNDIVRDIEEVQAFNAAVEAAVRWVEENSSWEETLIVATADHETGYLSGANDQPGFSALTGAAGEVPSVGWYSDNHTNMLVPVFVRGAGADQIVASAENTDPVRGDYIDITTIAQLTLDRWWPAG